MGPLALSELKMVFKKPKMKEKSAGVYMPCSPSHPSFADSFGHTSGIPLTSSHSVSHSSVYAPVIRLACDSGLFIFGRVRPQRDVVYAVRRDTTVRQLFSYRSPPGRVGFKGPSPSLGPAGSRSRACSVLQGRPPHGIFPSPPSSSQLIRSGCMHLCVYPLCIDHSSFSSFFVSKTKSNKNEKGVPARLARGSTGRITR